MTVFPEQVNPKEDLPQQEPVLVEAQASPAGPSAVEEVTPPEPSAELRAQPLIVCDNLVKIYRVGERDVVALQGLDMVVPRGDLLGIVGVSGSGKTTLMNVLGGLDRPTAGRVWVEGQDLLKMTDAQLDRYRLLRVGFVWQQTSRNLVPYLTAEQNVEMPLRLAGQVGRKCRSRTVELLDLVGISARRKHRLSELSGGEQQRVGIAVALANAPMLLLADEPTGEVDEKTALALYQLFGDLNRELGLTTLIVSHDPNLAHHVNRVISIRDGKIATESKVINGRVAATDGEVNLGPGEEMATRSVTATGSVAEKTEPLPSAVIEELTVVDSAGRFQIPKDYLEMYAIRGRVRLEPVEGGILIHPAMAPEGAALQPHESAERLIDLLEEDRKSRRIREHWLLRPFQKLGQRIAKSVARRASQPESEQDLPAQGLPAPSLPSKHPRRGHPRQKDE